MIVARDGGLPGINCGVIYAQNAARNGPAAWIAAQVPYRVCISAPTQRALSSSLDAELPPAG